MTQRKLPVIVMGRSMKGESPTETNPKISFELEAETGEIFEISFSLPGILSTFVLAQNWTPLKEELDALPPKKSTKALRESKEPE